MESYKLQAKYSVIRFYKDANIRRRIILMGLSLEQAREHCGNPETSSSTCTESAGKRRTVKLGDWFDGYEKE